VSVRRRRWKGPAGEPKETWVVDYVDQNGKRHHKTFARKRDADAYHATAVDAVRAGTHPADHHTTVDGAAELWLTTSAAIGLERATLADYRQIVEHHIAPLIGTIKLAQLTIARVRTFEDRLRVDRSPYLARKARRILGTILTDAQERGLVAQNVVRGLRSRRGKEHRAEAGKLEVGVDIPSPDEVRTLIAHVSDRWRPLLLTVIFTGLRASELRGLRWVDINLKRGELHVRQRADRYNTMGALKSRSATRSVPLPPMVINALREWKLACPRGELDLVFPNGIGRIETLTNIVQRGLMPTLVAAGVVDPRGRAKYRGLHAFRHFYASWCINRRIDGGLELPLKLVQARLGHASIQMTADTYGHLFPRGDDGAELAAAERAFFAG
jgi:integrase